ncbi:MAG: glycerol kinase GlpK [Verrucomicrobiota bacterium]
MSDEVILALDQGTTSSRTLAFDREGKVVAVSQQEFTQHFPQPGWVEHDAEEIWTSQEGTLRDVLGQLDGRKVAGMGITNQRETTVVWDRATGEPVHRAIVWQDRRTAGFCGEMKGKGLEERFVEKTGLRLDPYFSGTKLRWILDHVEGARERAERGELCFGTVDSLLIWKLTGGRVHATDVTNASRTLLMNLETGVWDEELCELLEIPLAMLPEVKSCSEVYGETEEGIAIAGVAGDQHAALFGQACFEAGMAKNTYGTGCFLLMNTGEEAVKSENNLLTTVAWEVDGKREYALEGSVFIGGAVVQWLRDGLGMISTSEEVNEVAATVEDNGGMYLVPAFAGLGAPHWDPFARGLAVGMTRGTTKGHFCRAALESIAFQSAELVECMVADSGLPLQELRVDGGATSSELLMQFQADLLEREVVRPGVTETTGLGAAYLAGLAVGVWGSKEEIARQWAVEKTFEPKGDFGSEERMAAWKRAVERAKGWVE